jgi:alpha-amylase/alpha-mannosidase (GH57 family)
MADISHALVLNLHQPAGNLEELLDKGQWEVKEILFAMDRIPRALWGYEDVARVHLSLSGTLLETLTNPDFQRRVYGIVDCGSLLWQLQNQALFEILGTGYYHPVMALIPPDDREAHLSRWLGIARHVFWREHFQGFWPPEMGFTMELIPLLRRYGYRYVLVDSDHVEPVTPMSWEELRYRPHVARYGGEEIVIVVRDRDLSNAQESGMEYGWFRNELHERTKWCGFAPLVTTCTDGENGGWFRNPTSNFWSSFYREFLDRARTGEDGIRPIFISEYLDRHGALGEVTVETGAWNTGWHHGRGFMQWTGSQAQKDALARITLLSRDIHDARWRAGELHLQDPELHEALEDAFWHLLRAETSCNYYWGEAWVDRGHRDMDQAAWSLGRARARMP